MEIEEKELNKEWWGSRAIFTKICEMIYMQSIAGRKRENVIGHVISHSVSLDSSWSDIEK
jgi:hypothetical protein